MEVIRAAIIDDERLARRCIGLFLKGYPDIEVVGEADSCGSGVELIRGLAPQLLFMDIQMPQQDGLHMMEEVGVGSVPAVIVVSAYDEFALRAFEINALDYLLKPFSRARFAQAIERARAQITALKGAEAGSSVYGLLENLKRDIRGLGRFEIKHEGRIEFVPFEEIDWVEAADNYSRLQVGGQRYLIRETIGKLESKLDPDHFCRIHRSFIVNVSRIKALKPLFNGDQLLLLRSGKELPVSRKHRDRLFHALRNS